MKRIVIFSSVFVLIIGCAGRFSVKDSINGYWEELVAAQSNQQELDILEELRSYLLEEHVSYEIVGKLSNDSLVNLSAVPGYTIFQNISIKFYYENKLLKTKYGWKPKDPDHAFYLFNE